MAVDNESDFKVTDRRSFNPDGTLREGVTLEQPAAAPQEPAIPADPAGAPSAYHVSPAAATAVEPQQEQDEDIHGMPDQTPFTAFLMEIASTAFIYLGMVEHPATGRKQVDMHAAKDYINILMMLKQKTKGNLSQGEEKFFDDLLADLQMQFMALNRR